jgi:hypothetical protein
MLREHRFYVYRINDIACPMYKAKRKVTKRDQAVQDVDGIGKYSDARRGETKHARTAHFGVNLPMDSQL